MTFSDKTKKEILENSEVLDSFSLLCGIVRGSVSLTLEKGKFGCVITSDLFEIAMFTLKLLSNRDAEVSPETKKGLNNKTVYNVTLKGAQAKALLSDTEIMKENNGVTDYKGEKIPENLDTDEKKRGYVAGVFLSAGEVFIPKGIDGTGNVYQLEFVFTSGGYAKAFSDFLNSLGFKGKVAERKESAVVYIKESETISDLLAYMGAVDSVLEMQTVKLYRAVRENENRITNCVFANLDKTVNTAQRQILAIEELKKQDKYNLLDKKLKDVAQARQEFPEDSLDSLAQKIGISKSCLNHRLRKIESIAKGEE